MEMDSIARVCHEVNRAYCQALGDDSQPTWEEAPEWQRASARKSHASKLTGKQRQELKQRKHRQNYAYNRKRKMLTVA